MEIFSKTYTLKNGYKINKQKFYDGHQSELRWCIWKPTGEFYMSCGSYEKAYNIASKL